MARNIFEEEFGMGKWQAGEVTIFCKILQVWIFYQKCLKSTSDVLKDLPETKTSESSQKFCKDPKFKILDYLPCPWKFPIQNYFLA